MITVTQCTQSVFSVVSTSLNRATCSSEVWSQSKKCRFLNGGVGFTCGNGKRPLVGEVKVDFDTEFGRFLGLQWVTCYNGDNDRAARVLFVQHPREQGEWLRQNPRYARVLTASFALLPRVLDEQHPRSPGHYPLNIPLMPCIFIYDRWQYEKEIQTYIYIDIYLISRWMTIIRFRKNRSNV